MPNSDFYSHRKGSMIAMIFWIAMALACYVCIYALLHNHFYDMWPIIGLIFLSCLFAFFSLLSLHTETFEFRPDEFYFRFSGLVFKTREKHWPYKDVYLRTIKTESRTKNGSTYITTTFYQLFIYSSVEKGGVMLKKSTNAGAANSFERLYNDFIYSKLQNKVPPAQQQNTSQSFIPPQQKSQAPPRPNQQFRPPGDHGI